MSTPASVEQVARDFARRIDQRDWDELAALLAADFRGDYRHDGKAFTRDEWVAYNADYPALVRFVPEDLVVAGDRAVLRSHVFNDDVAFYVASFLTVVDGLITELVEVWTDDIPAPEENQ
ncbi:nuclear transport factor 2 family protein [Nocardioides currus]|uniref:SnoaL-like domain-containing protein n=1 Tax=Nocardioides currus TaxID=2133958 RepID=A0A2R7YTZ8_9ACTN|nr:nuclear transport factor 2 family protein [Nocardioides currus]PUA79847.1 hypothetical protein C7S10_17445 [Nocardioides currus]